MYSRFLYRILNARLTGVVHGDSKIHVYFNYTRFPQRRVRLCSEVYTWNTDLLIIDVHFMTVVCLVFSRWRTIRVVHSFSRPLS